MSGYLVATAKIRPSSLYYADILACGSDVQYTEKLPQFQYFFNTDTIPNLSIFITDINIYCTVNIFQYVE